MTGSIFDNNEMSGIAAQIRYLDREVFELEKERSHLSTRASSPEDLQKLGEVEDRLRELRAQRRQLERDYDRASLDDLVSAQEATLGQVREAQRRLDRLSTERDRLIESLIPKARRTLLEFEDRLRSVENEINTLVRQINRMENRQT